MFNKKKLIIKNAEPRRPTYPLLNMILTESDTRIAKSWIRNRTWFTMSDLNPPHLALISCLATEKSSLDGVLVP